LEAYFGKTNPRTAHLAERTQTEIGNVKVAVKAVVGKSIRLPQVWQNEPNGVLVKRNDGQLSF
jgi:hypothetical protein